MDAVCALAGVLPPRYALHVARLKYLRRFARHCPQMLWNMLMAHADAETSWIATCPDSFEWFRLHYDVPFAPAADDFVEWLTIISIDGSWNGRVCRAAFSCLQHCNAIAERQIFSLRFSSRCEEAGGILPISAQTPTEKWQCDLCTRCFPSKKGLAAHAARAHGYKRIERYYATGTSCDSCGKYYHARARLLAHLYDCPDCLATLQACFPPISGEEVAQLDAEDKHYAIDMRIQGLVASKSLCSTGPLLRTPSAQT